MPRSLLSHPPARPCCGSNRQKWLRCPRQGTKHRSGRNRRCPRPLPSRPPARPGCGPSQRQSRLRWLPSGAHPSARPSHGPRQRRSHHPLSARLWAPPAATATMFVAAGGTSVCPSQFLPQAATVPSAFKRETVECPGGDRTWRCTLLRHVALSADVVAPSADGRALDGPCCSRQIHRLAGRLPQRRSWPPEHNFRRRMAAYCSRRDNGWSPR